MAIIILSHENSPFINEGKNILIEEFGTDYVIYESRYDEESFKKKVDIMVQQTPELHKMKIHIGSLSKSDM